MADDRLLFVAFTMRGDAFRINFGKRCRTSNDITRTNAEAATWTRFDALSERERDAAALRDPDAQPLTPDDMLRMRRTPQVKINRRALGLSQDEFAARFHIPPVMLQAWENDLAEPDETARAYLKVIARDPDSVVRALVAD